MAGATAVTITAIGAGTTATITITAGGTTATMVSVMDTMAIITATTATTATTTDLDRKMPIDRSRLRIVRGRFFVHLALLFPLARRKRWNRFVRVSFLLPQIRPGRQRRGPRTDRPRAGNTGDVSHEGVLHSGVCPSLDC